MKRAIVFGGGGSKGSYEFGAWKALNELNEGFDIATGTSIGSINAGFYVQHDYDAAEEFWNNLSMEKVIVNGINVDGNLLRVAEDMTSVKTLLKTYIKYKGADIAPFMEQLRTYADESKFFSSDIDYGLVTVKFPSFEPLDVLKSDISPGDFVDWIACSCACFPVFPVHSFGGQSYIDGGYYNNLPISTAFKLGADEVVAIDLNYEGGHPGYFNHPLVRYIRPTRDLGSFMCFEHDAMMKNLTLGYRDTMKYYGKLLGKKYSFTVKPERKEFYNALADRFMINLSTLETYTDSALKIRDRGSVGAPCTAFLEGNIIGERIPFSYLVAAFETCCDYLHIDNGEICDLDDYSDILLGIISDAEYRFMPSVHDDLLEAERLVTKSNTVNKRELIANEKELLIITAVLKTMCE